MIALDPDTRRRLIASARLLDSDKDGERLCALEAVRRLLPVGVTVASLLEMATATAPVVLLLPWQREARKVCDCHELFSDKELDFALNMRERRTSPTEKQWEWLRDLVARLEMRVAA